MTYVPKHRPVQGAHRGGGALGGRARVVPATPGPQRPGALVEDPQRPGVLHRIPTGAFVGLLFAVLLVLLLVAMRFDPMVDRPVTDVTEEDR